jgi:hypothetical protein
MAIPATFKFKLGKKPPVQDDRIPRMSVATAGKLPPPPPTANWWAMVDDWGMLANDQLGDCVEAAILHSILQMSTYAKTKTLIPTTADAELFYEAAGWTPGDPDTDQGSYVLGQNGMVPYWHQHGVQCGGEVNKVAGFLQIRQRNPVEWRQGISMFGGLLLGIQVPNSLMSAADGSVPFVWRDGRGPYEGGHEIWLNGYQEVAGEWLYDLVSWGAMYRASEAFLLGCMQEALVVINPAEVNAAGLNAAGLNLAQLTADLRLV